MATEHGSPLIEGTSTARANAAPAHACGAASGSRVPSGGQDAPARPALRLLQPGPEKPAASPHRRLRLADRLGAAGSLMCAVHCALLPLAIAAVPTLGLTLTGQADFERAFTVFATVLAAATLVSGYRRHRTFGALMFLVPGVLAIWFGAFGPLGHEGAGHSVIMAVGGTLVAAAHLLNIRLAHSHVHDATCSHGH